MEPFTIDQMSPISSWNVDVFILKVHLCFPSVCPAAGGVGLLSRSSKFGIPILCDVTYQESLWLSSLFLQKIRNPSKFHILWYNLVCTFAPWIIFCSPDHNSSILKSFLRVTPKSFSLNKLCLNSWFCLPPTFTTKAFYSHFNCELWSVWLYYKIWGNHHHHLQLNKGLDCTFSWAWMGQTAWSPVIPLTTTTLSLKWPSPEAHSYLTWGSGWHLLKGTSCI